MPVEMAATAAPRVRLGILHDFIFIGISLLVLNRWDVPSSSFVTRGFESSFHLLRFRVWSPVNRIAPNPSRLTIKSPPIGKVDFAVAAVPSFGSPPTATITPAVRVAPKNFRRVMIERLCAFSQLSTPYLSRRLFAKAFGVTLATSEVLLPIFPPLHFFPDEFRHFLTAFEVHHVTKPEPHQIGRACCDHFVSVEPH